MAWILLLFKIWKRNFILTGTYNLADRDLGACDSQCRDYFARRYSTRATWSKILHNYAFFRHIIIIVRHYSIYNEPSTIHIFYNSAKKSFKLEILVATRNFLFFNNFGSVTCNYLWVLFFWFLVDMANLQKR